jgi:Fe-S cluster assembly iron-binding protein IscA
MKTSIRLTPDAAKHLSSDAAGRVLRIAFMTGCGGSGYRLTLENGPTEGDVLLEPDGVTIALDSMAASKLDGALISYIEDDDGYMLDHPDAVMAVWCG